MALCSPSATEYPSDRRAALTRPRNEDRDRPTQRPGTAAGASIRVGSSTRTIGIGEFTVGRSSDCDVVVDDQLVSRRHARLTVTSEAIWIEDLGSANGVFVRDQRISQRVRLGDTEVVVLGTAEVLIRRLRGDEAGPSHAEPPTQSGKHPLARRVAHASSSDFGDDEGGSVTSATRRVSPFQAVEILAERALSLGRNDEAERVLSKQLLPMLERARAGTPSSPEALEWSVRNALRLAAATKRGGWVDYAIESFLNAGRLMPASIVDELYSVVRVAHPINVTLLRAYDSAIRKRDQEFGPSERFVARRIAGLERVVLAG